MTTIAYKDGVLAADTLQRSNGYVSGYGRKIWRQGRLLLGGAGSVAVAELFRDWVAGGLKGPCPLTKDIANVFIVKPDGETIIWCDDGPFTMKGPWSLGTGEKHAEGAMAMGASAAEAVNIAAQFDTATGGDLTILRQL